MHITAEVVMIKIKCFSDITEVQFTPTVHTPDTSVSTGLNASEYIAIGISSLLLGLIYVASVFLYLHIRKRRRVSSEENSGRGKGLKRDGTIVKRDILRIDNERTLSNAMGDDGVIKNNPLLSVGRSFDKSNFNSDSCSNLSDSEDMPDGSLKSEENLFNVSYFNTIGTKTYKCSTKMFLMF